MKLASSSLLVTAAAASSFVPTVWGAALLNNSNTAFEAFVEDYGADYDHLHCMGGSSSASGASDVCILWKIDQEQSQIELAVTAGASGWVGFGISEAGGMPGSDMMIFEAASSETVADYFALAYARPTQDACASDWQVQGTSVAEDGFLAVRVIRALDTGDPQDVPLVDDADVFGTPATHIIAAWGDEETRLSYHGANNVARSVVRFFAPPPSSSSNSAVTTRAILAEEEEGGENTAQALLQDLADGSVLVHETDYPIPARETTYYSPCFNASDYFTPAQMEQGVYLIGVEYVPSHQAGGNDNTIYLHHMGAQAGYAPCNPDLGAYNNQDLFYSWAPGGQPLVYPTSAGLKVGGGYVYVY